LRTEHNEGVTQSRRCWSGLSRRRCSPRPCPTSSHADPMMPRRVMRVSTVVLLPIVLDPLHHEFDISPGLRWTCGSFASRVCDGGTWVFLSAPAFPLRWYIGSA
jgi:hypothetical protein